MGLRKGYIGLVALLGAFAALVPTIASSEAPNISAYNEGLYYHSWMPATATVSSGGVVKFDNPYSETPHGLKFTGGSAGTTPSCTGIPAAASEPTGATSWQGECTFGKPGTYTFICTVHPGEMKGTITVKNVGEPIAITAEATSVTEHEATLKGIVNPEGRATKYFFNWGPTEGYGQETGGQPAGEGTTDVPASASLSGLAPATTYHFQLVAENSSGVASGADQTFTTPLPSGPPTAMTSEATSVTETSATLKGTADPDGRPTKYFFEWGTSNAYGQTTAEVPIGEDHAGHVASAALTALSPGAVYHFRLMAKNTSSEIAPGADRMFTTLSRPSPPTLTTSLTSTPTTIVAVMPIRAPTSKEGTPLGSTVEIPARQHGSSVHGSVEVSQAGVGGRLEVGLLASAASLAKVKHSSKLSIGRFLRSSLQAGRVSFAVPLTAKARSALHRRRRLAVTVNVVLTPIHGGAVAVATSVVMHA